MKRRDFLKISPALSLPFLLNGFSVKAAGRHPLLEMMRAQTMDTGKALVLIQLSGGNDGLNTVIPLDQYSKLSAARSNLLIPENQTLWLNTPSQTRFHPAMTGMQSLFNSNQMNIVQGASYANPTYSHFRATDIWLTGSDTNTYLSTGWLGRTLQVTNPGLPDTYPDNPLAVEIGSTASLVTQCDSINPAVTMTDPSAFYQLVNGITTQAPDNAYGHELTFIRLIKTQTQKYTSVITNAYSGGGDPSTAYPANNALADQLKIVARLIKGGLNTPVYVVTHPNTFDTHANQVDMSDTTIGNHANNLQLLSDAMAAFQQDLAARQVADNVVSMTVTEFGRRIKSNDSYGTDHGAATPIFFFGTSVNPVIVGTNPQIPDNVTVADQVPMQYDFKQVYYTVLKDWFQLTDDQLLSVFPTSYSTLPIFKQAVLPVNISAFSGTWVNRQVNLQWTAEQEINITGYDVQRSDDGTNFTKIGTVPATNNPARHTYNFTDTNLSKTLYYYRIRIIDQSGAISFSGVILLRTNQANNSAVKIFPNPVDDRFTVSFQNKITGLVNVSLADMNGREVWKSEQEVTDAFNSTFLLSGKKPTPGIYVVRLDAGQQSMTGKIVIR